MELNYFANPVFLFVSDFEDCSPISRQIVYYLFLSIFLFYFLVTIFKYLSYFSSFVLRKSNMPQLANTKYLELVLSMSLFVMFFAMLIFNISFKFFEFTQNFILYTLVIDFAIALIKIMFRFRSLKARLGNMYEIYALLLKLFLHNLTITANLYAGISYAVVFIILYSLADHIQNSKMSRTMRIRS